MSRKGPISGLVSLNAPASCNPSGPAALSGFLAPCRHTGINTIAHDVPPRDDRKSDILWTVNSLRQLPSLSHAQL
jgi:hypothetical protein